MKIKKELIFAVLATFCLTATLFMIVPTKSQSGSYDARTDVNGDGTIDMADISLGIEGFMTNGDPTLPVNISKHATYENTWIFLIPAYSQSRVVDIPTAGYESVSIRLDISTYLTTYALVDVWFEIKGAAGTFAFKADEFRMNSTYYWASRVYPVSGSTLWVLVENEEGYVIQAYVGVYMSA